MTNVRCVVLGGLLLLAVALLVAAGLIVSGAYNVAADRPHYALERWLFRTVQARSIAVRADVEVPGELDDPARIRAGILHYETQCAPCHLRPGMDETALRRGLNPSPPKLAEWSATPAETFWVVKHGIRSTGMPAWGRSHEDAELWDVVAFLRQLPDLEPAEYEAMLREARQQEGAHAHR